MNKNRNTGTIVALGCFIVMFIHLGTIGTAGLFIPQFIESFRVPVSKISLNVTFSSLAGFASSLLVGKLHNRLSAKKMLIIGSIAGVLHYLVGAVAQSVTLLYVGSALGGVTFGFGTQTCNAAIISQWYKEKSSSVIGIVFGGAALGSAILLFVSGILIERIGWRLTYIVFAALHLFIAIPSIMFLIKDKGQPGYDTNRLKDENLITKEKASSNNLSMEEIHKSLSFWILIISMVLCGTLITGFKTFIPSFWQANGMSPLTSSKYISLFMLVSTVSTMISGAVADKYGNRAFITYLHMAFVLGMLSVLIFSTRLELTNILITIILMSIAYPLYGSIPATVTLEAFGAKNYKRVCGELMAAFYIGLAVVSPIIGGLRDITGTYKTGFIIITIFGAISCIMILLAIKISPSRKKKTDESNTECFQKLAEDSI